MANQPPPILEIHFDGEHVYPEKIPVRALSDVLASVQRLVVGGDEFDEESTDIPSNPDESLRLIGIRKGSAVYKVSGPPRLPAQSNLRSLGFVLEHPDEVEFGNDSILKPVENLSVIGRRLGCDITIREPGSRKVPGAILARIGPGSYDLLSKSWLIGGETTIFGRVVRVGGATAARCGLRVPFQDRMFVCRVANSEIARQIGAWLYKDVAVSGSAQWLKHSFRLFSFTINAVSQPNQGSIIEAFEALRDEGGAAWDLIQDPDAYLEEVRREA